MADEEVAQQFSGLSLKTPEEFSFIAADWPAYRRKLVRWFTVSRAKNLNNLEKRETAMYIMGEKADQICTTFQQDIVADITFENFLKLFDDYFKPKTNNVSERGKFWDRRQKEGESNEEFIRVIYNLAERCEFAAVLDITLRDKLCHGMLDRKLAAELRWNSELDLKLVLSKMRSKEAMLNDLKEEKDRVKESTRLKTEVKVEGVDAISYHKQGHRQSTKGPPPPGKSKWGGRSDENQQTSSTNQEGPGPYCRRCGEKHKWGWNYCPAKDATCKNCKMKGHFEKRCFKRVKEVVQEDIRSDESFSDDDHYVVSTVLLQNSTARSVSTVRRPNNSAWRATIQVGPPNNMIGFKVDSGADVTVISIEQCDKLQPAPKCKPPKTKLMGASREPLKVVKFFRAQLNFNAKTMMDNVYVVKGIQDNLLGRQACESLGILTFNGNSENTKPSPELNDPPHLLTTAVLPTTNMKSTCTAWDPKQQFPKCFKGLGVMKSEYRIKLRDGAIPYAITTPRRIPHPIKDQVKAQLDQMERDGVISVVKEPTEWCAGLVPVPKASDPTKIRLCVDLIQLNKAIIRERIILPSVEETLAKFAGAKIFSKLDCRDSFWQVKLHPDSQHLTTFLTPWNRYCFNRLSMGLCSASEYFHNALSNLLAHIPGVVVHIDDIAVFGATLEEHDNRLEQVLLVLQHNGITLNQKCVFRVTSMPWVGYIISAEGSKPDPEQVQGITDLSPPSDKSEVKSFQARVQFLRKFVPHMANILSPITDLLKDSNEFSWNEPQQVAFDTVKQLLTTSPVLALYNPDMEHRVATDASAIGVGAVLEQQESSEWRPVCFASRRLTLTESRYAVIEREALGIVWACTKFHDYIMGKEITIRTDHKPLVSILGVKDLSEMTPRLQRMRLKLMPYSFNIEYVPGKEHHIPDWLSRSPSNNQGDASDQIHAHEVTAYSRAVIDSLPITDKKLLEISEATKNDPQLIILKRWIHDGFPHNKGKVGGELAKFWLLRDDLSEQAGLIIYKERIVVPAYPEELRDAILKSLHEGHQSVCTMRARANRAVYWPGLSTRLADEVDRCITCNKNKNQRVEPLMPSVPPAHPWQRVALDVADVDGQHYLVIADCYSRYPEVYLLPNLQSSTIISKCKETFARHGIPESLRCDNATPLVSAEFQTFLHTWGIVQQTSSPRFPQSNGQAESAVKIVKRIFKNCDDPQLGLLAYRNSPISGLDASPAQLAMSRTLRSTVPTVLPHLQPQPIPVNLFRERDVNKKDSQKIYHDKHHGARQAIPLKAGDQVWIKDMQRAGSVLRHAAAPRSYLIQTDKGLLRRNRIHLTLLHGESVNTDLDDELELIVPTTHHEIPPVEAPPAEAPPIEAPNIVAHDEIVRQGVEPHALAQIPGRSTRSGREVRAPTRLNL